MNKPMIPMPSQQDREAALFALAIEKTALERAAFLQAVCGSDDPLRQRLERLLAAHEAADLSLRTVVEPDQPMINPKFVKTPHARPPDKPNQAEDRADEAVGQTLGRYKLLEKIGEGGFGVVYVAEQREPVRRRVALKIIKLGMDTKEVVARFEAERQALAMMDHPNIAKVLDGGTTGADGAESQISDLKSQIPKGRPFFVMELVRGVRITQYCDEHQLAPEARLDLFIKVCHAIQHAHQKGIIHRDIKPANILVVEMDGVPVPKVIDFGIAKATQRDLTEKTVYTHLQQLIGTPAFMSPEQMGGGPSDIDTRSDIYSLGVLLYELLTGRLPFDPRKLLKAGVDEMRRIIRDVEPPMPSTQLGTLGGEELRKVAQARHIDSRRLGVLVRGDLDWVVMKALEKDRSRRYETSSALADDIRRFLNHEPVSAVAPNIVYKLRKFVRRHRAAVAAGLAVALLLVVGVTVTTWLAVVAARARAVAAREARKSSQVARFLQDMLEAVRPAKARGRDTAMLRELLDQTSDRVGRDLTGQPEVEFELRGTIGRTYEALGVLEPAEQAQRAALALARQLYGDSHTNTARVLEDLGQTLGRRSQFAEATNVLHEALSVFRNQLGEDHLATAGPLHLLGFFYSTSGNYAAAEPLLKKAVDIRRRGLPPDHRDTIAVAIDLATLYYQQGRLETMETLLKKTLEESRRSLGQDHPTMLNAMNLMAILRQAQGQFPEAERLHFQLLEIKRRILGPDHLFTLTSMDNLAIVYGFEGRYPEAEELCSRALASYAPKVGVEHRNTLGMRSNLAEYLRNQGRYQESEAIFKQIMEIQRRTMSPDDPFRQETQNGLAVQYHLQGREAEAEALFQDLLRIRRGSLAPDDPSLADTLARLSLVLLAQDRASDAEALAIECWNIHRAAKTRDWRAFVGQSQLGACQLASQRLAEAEPLLVESFTGLKAQETQIPAIERGRVREAIERLVRLGRATGQSEKTTAWQRELEQFNSREALRRQSVRNRKAAP